MHSSFGDRMPEVVVFHPTRFEEAEWIVHNVRELKTVIVHAGGMETTEAQRLIDFVAGGVSAMDGQAECLAPLTFVFAPERVTLRRDPGSPLG
jgi:FtsZ-interacting cell division protein YlmF